MKFSRRYAARILSISITNGNLFKFIVVESRARDWHEIGHLEGKLLAAKVKRTLFCSAIEQCNDRDVGLTNNEAIRDRRISGSGGKRTESGKVFPRVPGKTRRNVEIAR